MARESNINSIQTDIRTVRPRIYMNLEVLNLLTMTIKFNLEKSQMVKILVKVFIFFSGIAILIWQVHGTFETFFKNRTSFAVREESFDRLVPPTLIFCSRNQKAGTYKNWFVNISNKNQFYEDFLWLNEHLYLNLTKYIVGSNSEDKPTAKEAQLRLGENSDNEGNLLWTVEELMNPFIGLCYAIRPSKIINLKIEEWIILTARFEPRVTKANIYFTSEEDRYGLLFYDMGKLMPFRVSLDAGTFVSINLKKSVHKKLSSNGKCKYYTKEQSFMKCMLAHQVDCFRSGNQTCKCIPENSYKTHFKIFPIEWNACTKDEEYECGLNKMIMCYDNKLVTERCPLPCEVEEYRRQKMYYNQLPVNSNEMAMEIQYSTMNVNMHEEYQVQDIYNFIGTVGRSLGLFIGFSYTGFVENLLDLIMRVQNQYA